MTHSTEMSLTEKELERLLELRRATGEQWELLDWGDGDIDITARRGHMSAVVMRLASKREADAAQLVVDAVNALEPLVRRVQRLEGALERIADRSCTGYTHHGGCDELCVMVAEAALNPGSEGTT